VSHFPDGFDLITERVRIGDRDFAITHPRSAEDLIDDDEYADDERLPYWADLWPSGQALAAELADRPVSGARILELGAGLGLPSIVALSRGARVLATDWYPVALEFARANARAAGVGPLATMEVDWASLPDALRARGPFDVIIGADVAYERRHASQLAPLIAAIATPETEVVIADPRRPDANALVVALRDAGWAYFRTDRQAPGRPDEQGPVIYIHHFSAPATPRAHPRTAG
jgi:predicted nicotinamide N-methyase